MRRRLKTHQHMGNPLFFESHRLNAFTRFEFFPEMLLFATIQSTKPFIEQALDFFCHRFPPFVIAFYNESDQQLYVQSKRQDFAFYTQYPFAEAEHAKEWVHKIVQQKVPQRLEFKLDWNPSYFETFFESQFIEKRKNLKLQNRMMPLQTLDKSSIEYRLSKKHQRNNTNTRLNDFFFSKTPVQTYFNPFSEKQKGLLPKNAE